MCVCWHPFSFSFQLNFLFFFSTTEKCPKIPIAIFATWKPKSVLEGHGNNYKVVPR